MHNHFVSANPEFAQPRLADLTPDQRRHLEYVVDFNDRYLERKAINEGIIEKLETDVASARESGFVELKYAARHRAQAVAATHRLGVPDTIIRSVGLRNASEDELEAIFAQSELERPGSTRRAADDSRALNEHAVAK